MNRKILLIEPNYKNKYPPIGLMKISTYYKMVGDEVRFYKGDLKILAADISADQLVENLMFIDETINWRKYKGIFIDYFRHRKHSIIDAHEELTKNPFVYQAIIDAGKGYSKQEYFEHPYFDRVGITTLFTFYWKKTIETINFAKKLCKKKEDVMIGGIMSSLLPDRVYEETGIYPFIGQLNHPGDLDPDNELIIDELPLDYSILEEIDYKYPARDAYFAYMTRGCINNCSFCAVPKLETKFCEYIDIKTRIRATAERFGEQRNLLLLDNNVFASPAFDRIIDEIKECGFEKGAKYVPPNQYRITIKNLKDGYNDCAYVRKCLSLYQDLMKKLPEEEKVEFYLLLEKYDCLCQYSTTKESIMKLDSFVDPLFEKYFGHRNPLKRIVDFNQGLDARLVTPDKMKKLAEINIEPCRIAFDHWEQKDIYIKAIKTAVDSGIKILSNYLLYNFQDKPEHLYYRLRCNIELCEELDVAIYSFPMKYHPIDDPDYFMNRDYIGKHWNRKFIRAIQAVLNSTKGKVGRGKNFFDEAFGENIERFFTILWMPETFIIYRFQFKETLAKEWENAFKNLNEEDSKQVREIVSSNDFSNINFDKYNKSVNKVLRFYKFSREEAERLQNKNNESE